HRASLDPPVLSIAPERNALEREEPLFETRLAAGVPDEIALAADDTMARNCDGHRIVTQRLCDGTHRLRSPHFPGDPLVGDHGTVGNGRRRFEHRALKIAPGKA